MAKHSLPGNIDKLRLIPVSALRRFVQHKTGSDASRYNSMPRERLMVEASALNDLSEQEIDSLFENYRYGGRLSFYIYLIPETADTVSAEQLKDALELTVEGEEEVETTEGDHTKLLNLKILDEEALDDTRQVTELRYSYLLRRAYLNESEMTAYYTETQYGFIWLDFNKKYVAILSKYEKVNSLIVDQLEQLLGDRPLAVVLPKELVNTFFHLEDVEAAAHFDHETGIKTRVSREGLGKDSKYRDLILEKDLTQERSNSLYQESIAPQVTSGLGIVAHKGKLYLLSALPATLLRRWGQSRLPDIVAALREKEATGSLESVRSSFPFRGISPEGKDAAFLIMEALFKCRRQAQTSGQINLSMVRVVQTLAREMHFFVDPYCDACQNLSRALCPSCGSDDFDFEVDKMVCSGCRREWDYRGPAQFKCNEGHALTVNATCRHRSLLSPRPLCCRKSKSNWTKSSTTSSTLTSSGSPSKVRF